MEAAVRFSDMSDEELVRFEPQSQAEQNAMDRELARRPPIRHSRAPQNGD